MRLLLASLIAVFVASPAFASPNLSASVFDTYFKNSVWERVLNTDNGRGVWKKEIETLYFYEEHSVNNGPTFTKIYAMLSNTETTKSHSDESSYGALEAHSDFTKAIVLTVSNGPTYKLYRFTSQGDCLLADKGLFPMDCFFRK